MSDRQPCLCTPSCTGVLSHVQHQCHQRQVQAALAYVSGSSDGKSSSEANINIGKIQQITRAYSDHQNLDLNNNNDDMDLNKIEGEPQDKSKDDSKGSKGSKDSLQQSNISAESEPQDEEDDFENDDISEEDLLMFFRNDVGMNGGNNLIFFIWITFTLYALSFDLTY